ncbi:toll/interleukin-1 receptor domain-containing protein [Tahibacter caeni]|uniref:toll/interleukin-1 receptor domain-containing protein n=1 Tax=Tahibacter caeni TaxID=1453545 RepID=UPI0021486487|nr:toll/interleukin-1 receptor domain-containing protein [Tahibacter caeni]
MAAKVFISYAHEDEQYKNELLKHLSLLEREGLIEPWHDRRIEAGEDFTRQIDGELKKADIILLLISASFIASNYCYSRELKSAMERHEQKLAKVVPVIIRACDWKTAPFGELPAYPRDGKPIASWSNQDEAYRDIAHALRKLVKPRQATAEIETPTSVDPPLIRLSRYLGVAAAGVLGLAGLAYWQPWRSQPGPEPARPVSLLSERSPGSTKDSVSRRQPTPDAPAGTDRAASGSETTTPAVLNHDGDRQSTSESVSALPTLRTTEPTTPGTAEPTAPVAEGSSDNTLFASEGVIVITEIAATAAPGQAWESGDDLASLPDVLLCFRQTENGKEGCRPNWFGLASARTRAHDDASHAVDVFADMKQWNGTFWLALRDQDDFGRKLIGQGKCRFGRPCAIAWTGDGKTPVAEVLVLPALQSSEALRTQYLRACVDGSSVFAQQWNALVAFANASGIAPPAASRISYETLARTFLAATDIELTAGTLKAALDAGHGEGRLGRVANTFRATLLQAEANAGSQSPSATRGAVDRRSALLRQRFAEMNLDRLIAAGCKQP